MHFPKKPIAMHDKTTIQSICSAVKDQNLTRGISEKEHRQNNLDKNSQNQPVAFLGLAAAIGAFGGIINFPETAQSSPIQPSLTSPYSSNLTTDLASEQDSTIAESSIFKTEQALKLLTTETSSATAISVPQLPPFSLAHNSARQIITKQIYTVRAGDTISGIARSYGISPDEIVKANKIQNPNLIPIDQQLVIPYQTTAESSSKISSFSPNNSISAKTNDNTIKPVVTRDISTNISTNKESQNNLNDPYISKLRDDIDKLRNQIQDQYRNEESGVSINNSPSLVNRESLEPSYAPNPANSRLRVDIDKLRNQIQNQYSDEESAVDIDNTSSLVSQESLEPSYISNPNPVSSGDRKNLNVTLENNSVSEEALISFAINSIDNDNSPLIDRLSPQLPPLSSPEEYLPDNSNIFNGYMWPAQGAFTSGYGWRWGRMHKGIDIAAPIGTPILAAATGEVIFAGWNSGGYGNLVKVKHPDGSVTFYAHNNKIFVRRGQKIKQGQQIAEMGSTGYSTGPHLHFEIRTNGSTAVNPIALLPKK